MKLKPIFHMRKEIVSKSPSVFNREVIFQFALSLILLALVVPVSGQFVNDKFEDVTEIPSGKAVVFFYNNNYKQKLAYIYSMRIYENKKPIYPTLYGGGYFYQFIEPGDHTFSLLTNGKQDSVVLAAGAGGRYFVEVALKMGWTSGDPYLELIYAEKALNRIKKCRLINPEW